MSLVLWLAFWEGRFFENRLGRIHSLQRVKKRAGSVVKCVYICIQFVQYFKQIKDPILYLIYSPSILVSTLKFSLQP